MQKKCENCGDPITGSKRRFCNKCKNTELVSLNHTYGLDHDANAATAAGLTYGQYMGRIGSENLWENRRMHIYRR